MMIPEFRILGILLRELADFTGFDGYRTDRRVDETCKDWLEHLAKLKLERAKNEQE